MRVYKVLCFINQLFNLGGLEVETVVKMLINTHDNDIIMKKVELDEYENTRIAISEAETDTEYLVVPTCYTEYDMIEEKEPNIYELDIVEATRRLWKTGGYKNVKYPVDTIVLLLDVDKIDTQLIVNTDYAYIKRATNLTSKNTIAIYMPENQKWNEAILIPYLNADTRNGLILPYSSEVIVYNQIYSNNENKSRKELPFRFKDYNVLICPLPKLRLITEKDKGMEAIFRDFKPEEQPETETEAQ